MKATLKRVVYVPRKVIIKRIRDCLAVNPIGSPEGEWCFESANGKFKSVKGSDGKLTSAPIEGPFYIVTVKGLIIREGLTVAKTALMLEVLNKGERVR